MSSWRRVVSAVAVGASAGVALAHPKVERLAAIKAGQVSKKELEVVLAQHNEDASWSDAYDKVRTVYCKGESCAPGAVKLPNVGREGHTYLKHIVDNYDNLADWTVFSQAEAPSDGYFGQGRGGGHLVSGSSFEDYLAPPSEKSDSHFVFSSKVHIPSMQHAIRSSFRTELKAAVPSMVAEAVCPAPAGEDTWGAFKDISPVKRFLSEKCNIEEQALGPALEAFWEDFVQAPLPANGMVHYAQGARFSVSRQRLQQRSKAYYQQLLQAISEDSDPCLNYLYEWAWYYMMGQPEAEACVATVADTLAATAVVPARALQSGGVSGEEEVEVGDAVFEGSITIEVSADDAADLATNDTFIMGVQDSLADSLGVNRSWVNVSISVSGGGRRLQTTSSLDISYTITVPEASRAATDESTIWSQLTPDTSESSTFKSTFTTNIKTNANVDVVVASVSAPAVMGVVTTTTMATEADAAVRPEHGLALTALMAVAVAGLA